MRRLNALFQVFLSGRAVPALCVCLVALGGSGFGATLAHGWEPSPSECEAYASNEARRAGSVIGGAARSAVGGAIFGAIVGKGEKEAKRGAALGGLLGALGAASRKEDVRRRAYDYCMSRARRW